MSLLRRSASPATEILTDRLGQRSTGLAVTGTTALQQSVVWAARRLRADLLSLMPADVYRPSTAAGINVAVPGSAFLTAPSQVADGHPMSLSEWLYSSQMSLDGVGNSVGLIRARDAFGLPARVDLVRDEDVSMRIRDGQVIKYRIAGTEYTPREVWHERQFTLAGLPVGLSPIAFAALQIAGGASAAQFAVDWFANGAVPSAILKNGKKDLTAAEASVMKARFKASMSAGDVFVTGQDWEYSAVAAKAAESSFIEQMEYSDLALTRFFGVPADLVDVRVDSSTINYANITQRNLQLLVMNLGAAIKRRETALSATQAGDRFVKLNRDAILAMDAKSRADLFAAQIAARTRTPDQVRAIEDLLPLSEADYAQFERLFPVRSPQTAQPTGGN